MYKLNELIHMYISEAKQKLIRIDEPETRKVVYIVPSKRDNFIEAVGKTESGQIFKDLVELTCQEYKDNDVFGDHNYNSNNYYHNMKWQSLVQNFFRRSGFYLSCFNGTTINAQILCKKYHEAFQKRYINIMYMAPLVLVGFRDIHNISFNSFNIRRFTEAELIKITNTSINELFYPNSVWNVKDLSYFWFIEILVKKDIKQINQYISKHGYEINFEEYLIRNQIDLPEEINYALYNLLLYDWDKLVERVWDEGDRWDGFELPFVAKLDDNLLDHPTSAPDASRLDIYSDGPLTIFDFAPEETSSLEKFIRKSQELLNENFFNLWPFLKTALDYLKKGFFTESFRNAPEQLLWHITSIEALLAEPKKGVTRLLKDRLSHILGETKTERDSIRGEFNKIYNIRCDLVHGNPWKEGLSYKYLEDARIFARKSCLWFLYFLSNIRNNINDNEEIPARDDILTFIDLIGRGKKSFRSIKLLLDNAPGNISLNNLLKSEGGKVGD